MKDNFSVQAAEYAKFRPSYPEAMYDFINLHVKQKDLAWDCATGNGQIAIKLAENFNKVIATDISEKQIAAASRHPSIEYRVAPAENSGLAENSCDLITVGQAIHWFDFDAFNHEVIRVGKKNALILLAGYDLPVLPEKVNAVLLHFYNDILGDYWDPERRYIDEHYQTLPFPFKELETPVMSSDLEWTRSQMRGFVSTWSALQHYRNQKKQDPLPDFEKELSAILNENEVFPVSFPILIKAAFLS